MTTVDQSLLEIKKILGGLSKKLTSVNAKIDGASCRFDAVKLEMLETEKRSISRFDNVKKEIDSIKSEMLESEKRSKARNYALRVQLIDMENRTASKIDAVKSEIDSGESENVENRRFFNGEFTKLEKNALIRFDGMTEMLVSIRESIGVLKGKMNSTNQEMSSLKSDLSSTEEMIVDEMSTVRQSIESMRSDAESTTRALRAVEGETTATSNSMRNVETAFVDMTEKFDSSKSEFESLKTAIESFEGGVSIGMSSLKAQVSQVEEKVTSVTESLSKESSSMKADIAKAKDEITKEIVSVATSNNAAMEEQKASTTIVTQRLEMIILDNGNKLTEEMSAIKNAICQQTSTLGQLRSDSMETKDVNKDISEAIKQSVLESRSATRQHLSAKSTMILMQLDKNFPDFLKNVCIDSLVGKTVIHGDDSSKLLIVRSRYESLYSRGPLVSILMKFLLFHPKVRVHVDFGSNGIGRMKTEFIDFDGLKWKGGGWSTFPVLEEERVYLGGILDGDYFIALLAQSLCTMCLHLLYDNGGLPFEKDGDPKTEKKWDEMLKEAMGKKGRGEEGLGDFIHALKRKTRKGKLIDLISRVPFIIALNGSSNGINKMREWLPSILDLYQQQVVPDLTGDWESKMAA